MAPTARLLLIGDGECRPDCEALAKELGLADSIDFWGVRHDIPEILRAIDVFTLTSVSEAASLTLLEAMASSCPAVVTDVGGNAEHVRHEREGYLVGRGDHETLGCHLATLLRDKQQAIGMGKLARERVERHFNLEDVIEDYSGYYTQLVNA